MVSYKFSKTIGQSLFNHNKVLREFSNEYSNTLVCDCKQNPDIHDKLTKLIKKMYQNANAHYILVNTYTGKAFWSHTDKGSYKSFSLQHLLDALDFYFKQHIYQIWTTVALTNQRCPYGRQCQPINSRLISFLVGISISEQTCYKQRFQSTT